MHYAAERIYDYGSHFVTRFYLATQFHVFLGSTPLFFPLTPGHTSSPSGSILRDERTRLRCVLCSKARRVLQPCQYSHSVLRTCHHHWRRMEFHLDSTLDHFQGSLHPHEVHGVRPGCTHPLACVLLFSPPSASAPLGMLTHAPGRLSDIELGVVNEDGKACTLSFKIMGWLFVIGTGLGEMLLSIRTWAVWKKPRMMGYLLALFWCGVWGAIFAIMGVFLKTVRFDPNPDSPFPGCYISHGDQMERVLHAVFTGRVVLNIHRQSRKREELSYSNDGVILVPMTTTTNTFTDSQTKVPRGI
ncbi:hypothetical protein CC2G_007014 [Coprinopsis cinerea AmutBmut pab1-1]|nr:hypothetical protein CC2G_007014 [Coprinopsis cinerea AmutBmut pab1-1]